MKDCRLLTVVRALSRSRCSARWRSTSIVGCMMSIAWLDNVNRLPKFVSSLLSICYPVRLCAIANGSSSVNLEARWLQVGDLRSIERGSARSRSARSEDIVRYIAAEDPGTAERFALHLIDRAELLADFPELGTAYRKRKNVRRLRCDPYFIYYRVKAEERVIEVMEFWHSARLEPPF